MTFREIIRTESLAELKVLLETAHRLKLCHVVSIIRDELKLRRVWSE